MIQDIFFVLSKLFEFEFCMYLSLSIYLPIKNYALSKQHILDVACNIFEKYRQLFNFFLQMALDFNIKTVFYIFISS